VTWLVPSSLRHFIQQTSETRMQLAAKSYASPDHVAVQLNRARRMTTGQTHHLRSYLLAELIVMALLGELAVIGLKTHNPLLTLLALIPMVANLPRVKDLFLDVFTKECDGVNTAGIPEANSSTDQVWPQGRHQLTWQSAFAYGGRDLYADDRPLRSALQTTSGGTCFVAHRTRLLVSVAPAAGNVSENGATLSRIQVSDLAIGSIMHRLFRSNDHSNASSAFGVSLLVNTIRGDALATVAMGARAAHFLRTLIHKAAANHERPRRIAAPNQTAQLRGKPVRRSSDYDENAVSEAELTLPA
jgi:hypothetical protein